MSIKIYVEGGGDSKDLKRRCRRGFAQFIEKAGLQGRMPRIVACGSRQNAYESFRLALDTQNGIPMLLVDSEESLTATCPWEHLRRRTGDGWERPSGATSDHCHLMVQVMESWFFADISALESFFGQGFQKSALPANQNVEQIPKKDVFNGLARATKHTYKGSYHKGSHSFAVLADINPKLVEKVAPNAERFLDVLRASGPGAH